MKKLKKKPASEFWQVAELFECLEVMQHFTKGMHYTAVEFEGDNGETVLGFECDDFGHRYYFNYMPHRFFKRIEADPVDVATLAMLDMEIRETETHAGVYRLLKKV